MSSPNSEPRIVNDDAIEQSDAAGHFSPKRLRAAAVLSMLGPDLTALILFTLLWFGIMLAYGAKLHLVEGSILLPAAITAGLIGIAVLNHLRHKIWRSSDKSPLSLWLRVARILRDWLPLIYLVMVYETLRDYTGTIRPDYIDAALLRWDLALFGVEPTVWIGRWTGQVSVCWPRFS